MNAARWAGAIVAITSWKESPNAKVMAIGENLGDRRQDAAILISTEWGIQEHQRVEPKYTEALLTESILSGRIFRVRMESVGSSRTTEF